MLGHEGIGVVEALGPGCTALKAGDVVGWGYVNSVRTPPAARGAF